MNRISKQLIKIASEINLQSMLPIYPPFNEDIKTQIKLNRYIAWAADSECIVACGNDLRTIVNQIQQNDYLSKNGKYKMLYFQIGQLINGKWKLVKTIQKSITSTLQEIVEDLKKFCEYHDCTCSLKNQKIELLGSYDNYLEEFDHQFMFQWKAEIQFANDYKTATVKYAYNEEYMKTNNVIHLSQDRFGKFSWEDMYDKIASQYINKIVNDYQNERF